MSALKILLADDQEHSSVVMQKALQEQGIECLFTTRGTEVIPMIEEHKPRFLVIDLLLPGFNALQCLQAMATKNLLKDTKVFVTSGHSSPANVKECLRFGAVDYLVKPFEARDLMTKLAFHSQTARVAKESGDVSAMTESLSVNLGLIERMIKVASETNTDMHAVMHSLASMASVMMSAKRCNFIEASLETGTACVMAASDDVKLKDLKIELSRYPEVVHCLNTEKTIALENLSQDKVMSQLKKNFKNVQFNSMIVAPIPVRGKTEGVFAVRLPEGRSNLTEAEIQMTRIVADLAGLAWSTSR